MACLSCATLPTFGEGIEGGKLFEQGFLVVVLEGFGHQPAIGIVILRNPLGDDADRHAVDIILADPARATQRTCALATSATLTTITTGFVSVGLFIDPVANRSSLSPGSPSVGGESASPMISPKPHPDC